MTSMPPRPPAARAGRRPDSSRYSAEAALTGANADYLAGLYARYLESPARVDASWKDFFDQLSDCEREVLAELQGASWAPDLAPQHEPPPRRDGEPGAATPAIERHGRDDGQEAAARPAEAPGMSAREVRRATLDSIRALMLIRAFRVRGHLVADLDPLGLCARESHPELDYRNYGFSEADLDRPIFINYVLGLESATLREIISILEETYCGTVGVEFMHIQDPEQKAWIQARIESIHNRTDFTVNGKRAILQRLIAAEEFEKFLHRKYVGTKRFGLDGGEALVPAMEQIMKRGGQLGLKEIVLGMAHRGRLNVLGNVMKKPFTAIFSEFEGEPAHPEDVQGSGDVKYHLGTSSDRDFDGKIVHLSLTANPSHLEAVDPVVLGKCRAKQIQHGDTDHSRVAGLLLHGDAAFAGQGLVAETLAMSQLTGYRVGGTLHIVINNQIGFTTTPAHARSGVHATDVALMVQTPIFHVNGDDPEAVVHVARLAIEFRQKFGKDVVINLMCYRRFGHNESDEPSFTQPLMYQAIADKQSTRELYAARLQAEGVITEDETAQMARDYIESLDAEHERAEGYRPNEADWLGGAWSGLEVAPDDARRGRTAVSLARLQRIGQALTAIPEDFHAHRKIVRQLDKRHKAIEAGEAIDWATAEALAFGALLTEGVPVRLSGQDSGRGTFSQRHSVLYDQSSGEGYRPLNHIERGQAHYEVIDSPLSEAGVLGFEYGYSLAEPHALVMWEAQFGDFVNGAQVIIDQFVVSGEAKWLRMSGLVMLLPHGYEGQGPEHSSARLERFLNLCAEDNIQVANCTTPANYFHVLRRQVHRTFRKPLVLITPKSLLRHRLCVSPLSMFSGDEGFHRVLHDGPEVALKPAEEIRRVVLCSGKVYYDLHQERQSRGIDDIVLLRLEQLYPFPDEPLAEELERFPNADVVWCQEEPRNMGAWHFVDRRIETVLSDLGHGAGRPRYAGRKPAASPATGLHRRHIAQQEALVDAALSV